MTVQPLPSGPAPRPEGRRGRGPAAALAYAIPVVDDGLVPSEALGIVLAGLTGWSAVYWAPMKDRASTARTGVGRVRTRPVRPDDG